MFTSIHKYLTLELKIIGIVLDSGMFTCIEGANKLWVNGVDCLLQMQ